MDLQFLFGMALSVGIGVSLGLIGGGGSIVTVPVLVYVLGVAAHEAVAMSLAVVGTTSLIGAALHARRGAVRGRVAVLFAGPGILAAFLGSRLSYLVSGGLLLVCFAALMLIVSLRMLAGGRESEPRSWSLPKIIVAGVAVGFLTGFLGVGGGFLIVPALVLFAGLRMHEAIGTSLVVIAINCVAGLVGHWEHGFDIRLAAVVSVLAGAGVLLGSFLADRVSSRSLRRVFASFVFAVAVFLLVKSSASLEFLW